jgi:hypothetical protein
MRSPAPEGSARGSSRIRSCRQHSVPFWSMFADSPPPIGAPFTPSRGSLRVQQFGVVAVLGGLAVGVGGAQDESPGVQAAVAQAGLVERVAEGAVGQVVEDRVAAEDVADGLPGGGFAEGAEGDDLEQPILGGAGLAVVAHVADHVLRDPVGGADLLTGLRVRASVCRAPWTGAGE